MSLINGDKSRAGRQRKSKQAQREKNRLLKPAAATPAPKSVVAVAVKK
jgi:hypothetical protein